MISINQTLDFPNKQITINNPVGNIDWKALGLQFSSLRVLELTNGNGITRKQLEEIRESLPTCLTYIYIYKLLLDNDKDFSIEENKLLHVTRVVYNPQRVVISPLVPGCFPAKTKRLKIGSNFHGWIDPVDLPVGLTHLTLGKNYCHQCITREQIHSITDSLLQLKHLMVSSVVLLHDQTEFSDEQNKILRVRDVLYTPSSLQTGTFNTNCLPQKVTGLLLFGNNFNGFLEEQVLPSNLTQLEFGMKFNQPLPKVLPMQLRKLVLGDSFNQSLPVLPASLLVLSVGRKFNQPLTTLPDSLTQLFLGDDFEKIQFLSWPASLTHLKLGRRCPRLLGALPVSLANLHLATLRSDYSWTSTNKNLKVTWGTATVHLPVWLQEHRNVVKY